MPHFHPYVPHSLATHWYILLERRRREWTMWTMWFIYFMNSNQLFSVYSNLGVYTEKQDVSLVINRKEAGLHIRSKIAVNITRLLHVWENDYVMFPTKPVRIDWDGRYVPDNSQY